MKNTVADLIEYLKTLPPETKVEVLVNKHFLYEGDIATFNDLDINNNTYYHNTLGILELGSS